MAKDRATDAQFQERVKVVMELLLGGHSRSHIIRSGAEHWKVGVRQVDNYIAAANAEIDEVNANSAERMMALITSNLWKLYRTHEILNPSTARLSLKDIAKLRGLDKLDFNGGLERPLKDMSDEELNAALG